MSGSDEIKNINWKHGDPVPNYADRKLLAEIITQEYFPVSARTLREWPLVALRPNKRVVYDVKEALAYVEERLATCPSYRQSKG